MIKKSIFGLIILSISSSFFVSSKVITPQYSSFHEEQFKKDFLLYTKFLHGLSQEELFSALVLEDIASLYRDGRFYNDNELNSSVGSLMTMLATKAARPGVSYAARQFVADIVSDYATSSRGKSIQLEYLVNKISRVHEHEEEARIAKDEEEMQRAFLKRIKKEEQERRDNNNEFVSEQAVESFYFAEQKAPRKKITPKKLSTLTPKKTSIKKSEKRTKLEAPPAINVTNEVPVVRAKRGRPKKEAGASASGPSIKRSNKVLAAPKITTTPKRVRKKSS